MIKVVTLAGSFAHTGKNRIAAVSFGNIVNQFHNQHGLANARTAEQTDFTALNIRFQQVNNFNAGRQNLCFGRLVNKRRRRTVNRIIGTGLNITAAVNRFADNIDNAPEHSRPDRNFNRPAGIDNFLTAHQTVRRIHGNRPYDVFAQVLRNLQYQRLTVIIAFQSRHNIRQIFQLVKANVNNRTGYLGNMPDAMNFAFFFCQFFNFFHIFFGIFINLFNGLVFLSNICRSIFFIKFIDNFLRRFRRGFFYRDRFDGRCFCCGSLLGRRLFCCFCFFNHFTLL